MSGRTLLRAPVRQYPAVAASSPNTAVLRCRFQPALRACSSTRCTTGTCAPFKTSTLRAARSSVAARAPTPPFTTAALHPTTTTGRCRTGALWTCCRGSSAQRTTQQCRARSGMPQARPTCNCAIRLGSIAESRCLAQQTRSNVVMSKSTLCARSDTSRTASDVYAGTCRRCDAC